MHFKDVIGHSEQKELLIGGARAERIPHAQLFVASVGTGGLPMALAYAQFLQCNNPTDSDSCGECSNCKLSSKISHPDIQFSFPVIRKFKSPTPSLSADFQKEWMSAVRENPYLDYTEWMLQITDDNKQGNISAQECNEIIKKLKLKAFQGKKKIHIIWMAEYLGGASNKLLKIIEEPPENTVIILITESMDALLATIISRMQTLIIPRIGKDDLKSALVERFQTNGPLAERIAHVSDGNYSQALKLLENPEADHIEILLVWYRAVFRKDHAAAAAWIDQVKKLSKSLQRSFIQYNLEFLRKTMHYLYASEDGKSLTEQERKLADYLTQALTYEEVNKMVNLMSEAAYHLERNAQIELMFFDLFISTSNIIRTKKLTGV